LTLMILSMICWGSWANTQKLTGKWRFELFYFDYAFGVFLGAIILAFTFGTMGYDGFAAIDDIRKAGKHQELYGFLGGVVFNLANMLLVAAISVAGLAVAFPVAIGLALVIGVILNYVIDPGGNPLLLFGGAGVVVIAIIVDAFAYRAYSVQKLGEAIRAGAAANSKKNVKLNGILLSLVSGVLMGSFFPIVQLGVFREPGNEAGLGPYAIGLIFALGVLLSTFVFSLFFMRLPVHGTPVSPFDYFTGTVREHALGIGGGMIWMLGTTSNFVAASALGEARVGPAVSYGLGQGATMISVLWGLLYWKEFAGSDAKVKTLLAVMFFAFLIGLTMVSTAPLFPK